MEPLHIHYQYCLECCKVLSWVPYCFFYTLITSAICRNIQWIQTLFYMWMIFSCMYWAVHSPNEYALLQYNVNTLGAWSFTTLLKFNPSTECKTMFISCRRLRRTEPSPLYLNGSLIEAADYITEYLGISIASDLTWSQHIQSIISKTRRLVGLLLWQYYHYADTNVL